MLSAAAHARTRPSPAPTFVERPNGPQHELALRVFMVIVLAHWAEPLAQAFQRVIAMYHHMFPNPAAAGGQKCTCAWNSGLEHAV